MSNTPAESVPAAQPQAQAADAAVTENTRQPKKFDNVQKTVASKAKAFLHVFHSTGENIRGNINAALDGAGDAIAGRKSGEISGRKSGEQTSRRSVEPTVVESTSAPVEAAAPAAAATVTTEAPVATPAEAPATAPAEASTSTEAAPATNAATDSTNEASGEKRVPVGQALNLRFRRTVDLVIRVGSSLRSKGTRTAESLGSSLAEKKERASRRFSRVPKAAPAEEANASASPVPASTPLPEVPAQQPAETTA